MTSAKSDRSFSIILVEDEESARELTSRLIADVYPNCTIYTAGNGVQGLEIFKQFTPDIVMTDLNMPVMDGLEMIGEISTIQASTRYIVVTARNDEKTVRKCQEIGLCALVLKPINFNDLFEALEKCI
jgi:YesN/AraC family two-component response regulator